jgi:beta-lactamase regulating signal transducer with metallopeptidase domain
MLHLWGSTCGFLLLGTGILTFLAWLLGRRCRWATHRRTVWRLTIVGFMLVLVLEITGMASSAAAQLSWHQGEVEPLLARDIAPVFRGEILASSANEPSYVWVPLAVWWAGSSFWLGRLFYAHVLLHRLCWRLQPCSVALQLEVAHLARTLHCRRRVRVGTLAGLQGPLVFGLVRPTMALPPGFEKDFSAAQQHAILTHELSHVAARDPFWQLLTEVVLALLWWHPLMWVVRRQLRRESETAADEATLRLEDGPGLLAESLLILGRRLSARPLTGALAMADPRLRSQLARRVDSLLRLEGQPLPTMAQRAGLMLGTIALLVAGLTSGLALRSAAVDLSGQDHWQRSLLMQAWASLRPAQAERGTSFPPTTPVPSGRILARRLDGKVLRLRELSSAGEAFYKEDVVYFDDGRGGTGTQLVLRPMKNGKLLTDEEIMGQLQLTADQQSRFDALRQKMRWETLELYRMTSGQEQRGLEINGRWRQGLQEILTSDQYRRYLDYWAMPTP